jgi:hypothetical protein
MPLTFPTFDSRVEMKRGLDQSEYVKDCIREPWPTFPEELVQAFVIELSDILTLKVEP